jgi:hypothetical protein
VNAEKLWVRDGSAQGKKYSGRILHPDFAERLVKTADMNPNVPPMRSGRLTYIQGELEKRGHAVSIESVRKWFSGESKPHDTRAELLAEILRVDAGWLLLGTEATGTPQERRVRNAMADGVVNVVAGLMQLDGAVIAFPTPEDRYAIAQHIDLTAIIRGASYSVHVVLAEEREKGQVIFSVPTDLRNTVPLGVHRREGFELSIYEITDIAIEMGTPGKQGKIEVSLRDEGVREIESFTERF